MIDTERLLLHFDEMQGSKLGNYIVPGLESWLLNNKEAKTRIFVNTREQVQYIAPHTHRYAFAAYVLRGYVQNTIWQYAPEERPGYDLFTITQLGYSGNPGRYPNREEFSHGWFAPVVSRYGPGEWYLMEHDDYHSIRFSRDAVVIMFEGPERRDSSYVLEPCVNDETVATAVTASWMFKELA
jgi:hypothetical protein